MLPKHSVSCQIKNSQSTLLWEQFTHTIFKRHPKSYTQIDVDVSFIAGRLGPRNRIANIQNIPSNGQLCTLPLCRSKLGYLRTCLKFWAMSSAVYLHTYLFLLRLEENSLRFKMSNCLCVRYYGFQIQRNDGSPYHMHNA